MKKELIKKVIELFKDWYEDNAEHTFDLFDRCDYIVESFMESEQAEDLLKAKEEPKDAEEYIISKGWDSHYFMVYVDGYSVERDIVAILQDFANQQKPTVTDEEINKESYRRFERIPNDEERMGREDAFYQGAKYVRDKLKQ